MRNIAAYRFVPINDVDAVVTRVRDMAQALDLKGTVLLAPEGVNLFLAGEADVIERFLSELAADARFSDLPVRRSDSDAVPFARLKVKRKREIITFRRDGLDPGRHRAASLPPETLARWIAQGSDDHGREFVLLDTRNDQEVAFGTFAGALTLPIAKFTEFPAAIQAHRTTLADKTVVSFCTGGIRCEKAALWMDSAGFSNVLQLEGGILHYFERVGRQGFHGDCFVFDERVALDDSLAPTQSARLSY